MKTEHQRLAAQMENCKFCLDSAELAKHLTIAIGLKVSEYFPFLVINQPIFVLLATSRRLDSLFLFDLL